MQFFRVITDEPLGVAIGFEPSPALLDRFGAELDEGWKLVSDDGTTELDPGECAVWLSEPTKGEVTIARLDWEAACERGWTPLGPDLTIWRDEAALERDLDLDDAGL